MTLFEFLVSLIRSPYTFVIERLFHSLYNGSIIEINSLAFSSFLALFREIRDRVIFSYKIADENSKNSIFIQTKDKFAENSMWRTFKYPNNEIQNKKVKSFSKIKKLGSFFDFHTKRPKLQMAECHW
jgi:hypothetical protein